MKKIPRPDQNRIDEWFESQVTEYFFYLIASLKQQADDGLRDQPYVFENAEALMADRANRFGLLAAYENLEDVFKSKSLEPVGDIDESIGDSPDREPGTD